jgi:outer membrane protein OmpA-like peptidoglycan-associated protein
LDDTARQVIADAAAQAQGRGLLRVGGFAAPPGRAGFSQALSEARARNVADALRTMGVPAGRIRMEPRGAVPFEMISTESRRVEIASAER